MRWGGGWATGLLAAAGITFGCSLDSAGLGHSSAATIGDVDTQGDSSVGDSTSHATDGGSPTTDPSGEPDGTTEASTATSAGDATGMMVDEDGVAVLELADPPEHADFGPIDLGGSLARGMTITNAGEGVATELAGSVAAPFEWSGGAYPGLAGDCATELAPGESCEIELVFTPTGLGPFGSELLLEYDDGRSDQSLSRTLSGQGVGATGNLVVNGDAEQCATAGQDPPGWTQQSGTGWQCSVAAASGDWGFYCGYEPEAGTFELRQDVDVSAYAGMELAFSVMARSYTVGDDEYRIDLVVLDELGATVDDWTSGWRTTSSWTAVDRSWAAPASAAVVSVRLLGAKGGGNWCDAYFDDVVLRASYGASE
jgi:hypothetical protein